MGMRKVSSAPALQDLNRTQNEQQSRIPKVSSTSSLRRKETQTFAQMPSKSRSVATRSFPFLMDHAIGPEAIADLQEFAESARGIASFDCFEKYGIHPRGAPALRADVDDELVGRARVAMEAQEEEEEQSLASCLATPYPADERNLGEQVETAAREGRQAVEEELSARVAATGVAPEREVDALHEKDDVRRSPQRRKRRLLEAFQPGAQIDTEEPSTGFEDNDLAQRYLAQQASIETSENRLYLADGWACNEQLCHPTFHVHRDIFSTM